MARELPSTPYFIRAVYEWCADCGYTPYISVRVNAQTRVPAEFVKDGQIVLNISQDATRNLTLGNEAIQFSARFSGSSREISVPVNAVTGIFARETGKGFFFEVPKAAEEKTEAREAPNENGTPPSGGNGKPKLQVIK